MPRQTSLVAHLRAPLVALLFCAVLLGAASHPAHAYGTRVTAYLPTGNAMASGDMPFSGAAACSHQYPMGTQIQFWDGFVATCLDCGLLDAYGVDIDLFAWTLSDAYYLQAMYSGTNYTVISWGAYAPCRA